MRQAKNKMVRFTYGNKWDFLASSEIKCELNRNRMEIACYVKPSQAG